MSVKITLETFESQMLAEVNMARTEPAKYVMSRFDMNTSDRDEKEAINYMLSISPIGPLRASPILNILAKERSYLNSKEGKLQHSDMNTIMERIPEINIVSENIAWNIQSPKEIVKAWIIDKGVPNRGHRVNIFERRISYAGSSLISGYSTMIYAGV